MILDEEGRLFGRVNVVDAAVVAGLLFLVLAGGAVALGSLTGGEEATRYATLDLGERSPAVADRIAANDTSLDRSVTLTDVYVGPSGNGNVSVVARAKLDGTLTAGDGGSSVFAFGGGPLQRGDEVGVETGGYDIGGAVVELSETGGTLDTGTLPVVVETSLPAATRAYVEPGDTDRRNGRPVATVEGTLFPPTGNETVRTDLVGLTLRTVNHSGGTHFGGTELRVGKVVRFDTDRYNFSGSVVRWGSAEPAGEVGTTAATVVLRGADPAFVDGVETGAVERRGETVTARVTDKRVEPATVVLTSESGNIYEREHPRNVDVTLTVELRTRQTDAGLRFHTRALREGTELALDLGSARINGTVTDLGE